MHMQESTQYRRAGQTQTEVHATDESRHLPQRIERIPPSMTLQINAEASAMQKSGSKVVRLGAGEPDFDTPEHIRHAAKEAIDAGFTHYTAVDGYNGLKEAVREKFRRDNDLDFSLDNIMVTCGAKQALYNICETLLRPGDEAVIPQPYWVSYPAMTTLAEGKPIYVDCSAKSGFTLTPEALDEAITEKTRLVFLNSPNNPTGRVYGKAELKAIGAVLREYPHVYIVSDEIYEHLRWTSEPYSNFLNENPDLRDRCLIVNGVSKAYAMTGWRVGFMAGPKDIIAAMKKLQGQSTAGTASISQHAAREALSGDQSAVRRMVDTLHERHDYVLPALNALPGVHCQPSEGTFYAFPDFSEVIAQRQDIDNDYDLAETLLQEAQVALVPGSAFGAPGHLRLSFAADRDTLAQGIERLERFLHA